MVPIVLRKAFSNGNPIQNHPHVVLNSISALIPCPHDLVKLTHSYPLSRVSHSCVLFIFGSDQAVINCCCASGTIKMEKLDCCVVGWGSWPLAAVQVTAAAFIFRGSCLTLPVTVVEDCIVRFRRIPWPVGELDYLFTGTPLFDVVSFDSLWTFVDLLISVHKAFQELLLLTRLFKCQCFLRALFIF